MKRKRPRPSERAEGRSGEQREVLLVGRRDSGRRLDLFLIGTLPELSRKQAKRWIDGRHVAVDGRIESMASRPVQAGQRIEVRVPTAPVAAEVSSVVIPVLYEDDHCVAVAKPPGIPSGPTRDRGRTHVEGLMSQQRSGSLTLLHRLDKDTTGVLLLGKTKEFSEALLSAFRERLVEKTYLALVSGSPPDAFAETSYLREGEAGRMQTVRSGGAVAETRFRTLWRSGSAALVEAQPRTGRTHQIRVHLANRGWPILGDSLYGGQARLGDWPLPRQMLHAAALAFQHPASAARLEVQAPPPEDFLEAARRAFGGRLPPVLGTPG